MNMPTAISLVMQSRITMSSKKQAKGHDGYGDFMEPIIELIGFIAMFVLFKVIGEGIPWLVKWLIAQKNNKPELKKIERKELNSQKIVKTDDALGYSVTQKREILTSELERKRHSLIVGASGYGKTVAIDTLIYSDLKSGKPVIYIDPKGDRESLEQFINLCRLCERDYQIFSECYYGAGKISLNPVKDGTATQIADRIHASFMWSEPYYALCSYDALKSAIKTLKRLEKPLSFAAILDVIKAESNPNDPEALFDREDIKGIISRLDGIIDSDFGVSLSADGLSFKQAWASGKCIYIGLPVLGYPVSARSLGKMILGDLSFAVYDKYRNFTNIDYQKLKAVGVHIDELSAIITDEFIEILNKSRKAEMEFTFAIQSPSDLEKISPELKDQIFENTDNWLIFKQRVAKCASEISEAIGTKEGAKQTLRIEDGVKQELGSTREVEELIAHPNILKNLRPGQCILLRQGPTQAELINFKYLDPEIIKQDIEFFEECGFINKVKPEVKTIKKMEQQVPVFNKRTGGLSGKTDATISE